MIESESGFVWRQLVFVLKLPFLLILVLFGKRGADELTKPLRELGVFLFEPKLTVALIFLNSIVYLLEIFYLSEEQLRELIFMPADLLTFNVVPIVSSWFLHANLLHLLGNMLFLYIFGRILERKISPVKYLLVYFMSALIADVFSALAGQGGLGASGAIAGIIAVAILIEPFYLTYMLFGFPMPVLAVAWIAIWSDISGVLYPVNDGIGHWAHLGGYCAVFFAYFALSGKRNELQKGLLVNIFFVLLITLYYLFFI
ncbi:rhomboid family intramembrane serine protease [Candidatus Woesearchaeota archaeon]|nr:rhomboid family intramembrane serine protease [Candidatus Woesearchaeota archaeon]